MKQSKALITLVILTGLLAIIQAGAGLFWPGGGQPFDFTTLRGETVQINGQGLYFYDTAFKAPILRGTDAVSLIVCVPLLAAALLLYRRGSLRGGLLLIGVLAYFVYNAASNALGTAQNNLFLVYLLEFSASLFAFILAWKQVNERDLAERVLPTAPRRGMAALMFVSGLGLLFAWLPDILTPLLTGAAPKIASYTTEATYVFDLGIIAPAAVLTGYLLLRRASAAYLPASTLLIMLVIVGLMVTSQTVFQLAAGIQLSVGEFIGKAGSFIVLSLVAVGLLWRFFKNIREPRRV